MLDELRNADSKTISILVAALCKLILAFGLLGGASIMNFGLVGLTIPTIGIVLFVGAVTLWWKYEE